MDPIRGLWERCRRLLPPPRPKSYTLGRMTEIHNGDWLKGFIRFMLQLFKVDLGANRTYVSYAQNRNNYYHLTQYGPLQATVVVGKGGGGGKRDSVGPRLVAF